MTCATNGANTGISGIVDALCDPASYRTMAHRANHDEPMPSVEVLREIIDLFRAVLFPGYFGSSELTPRNMQYYLGATLDRVVRLLEQQVMRGLCFQCPRHEDGCTDCAAMSRDIVNRFVNRLPQIRNLLASDVLAAFEGDPAAKSPGEAIFCYPSIRALTNHRLAHELHLLEVPLIPRIISELAHSETGIDIHPGASIDEQCFIDHGTGVVIGETSVIGKRVRIYQGVTLGAKTFPKDEHGNPIKGIARHPIVEDNVVIYSGATILGRVRIGAGAVIGGNVWLTRDVAPRARIMQGQAVESIFGDGSGI